MVTLEYYPDNTLYSHGPFWGGWFKIFSLSLVLSNLIMMCLGAVFFMFLVFDVYWVSWINSFLFSTKFSAIIFSKFFMFLFSFRDFNYPNIRPLDDISRAHCCSFPSFFKILFFFVCYFRMICIAVPSSLFIFPSTTPNLLFLSCVFISHIVGFISRCLIWTL